MNMIENATNVFNTGKQTSKKCIFCSPIAERVLFETNNFRVLIDTYPIVPGHLLITTKNHYGNACEFPNMWRREFIDLKKTVRSIALNIFPSVVFYEHGKAGSCHSSSSQDLVCEHFHYHCLPMSKCIHREIMEEFSPITVDNETEFFFQGERFGSYLFFENSEGIKKLYPAEAGDVPSHFLRTLLCRSIDSEYLADWQRYDQLDLYLQSLESISIAYQREYCHAVS